MGETVLTPTPYTDPIKGESSNYPSLVCGRRGDGWVGVWVYSLHVCMCVWLLWFPDSHTSPFVFMQQGCGTWYSQFVSMHACWSVPELNY